VIAYIVAAWLLLVVIAWFGHIGTGTYVPVIPADALRPGNALRSEAGLEDGCGWSALDDAQLTRFLKHSAP
jgi:hypothetical protein